MPRAVFYREWQLQIQHAKVTNQKPKLASALLRTFSQSILPEGMLFFSAMMVKYVLSFIIFIRTSFI